MQEKELINLAFPTLFYPVIYLFEKTLVNHKDEHLFLNNSFAALV
jgi:hypothetical protein